MKTSLICAFILMGLAGVASAAIAINEDWTANTVIPDGSPVGITASQTFQDLVDAPILNVNVDLDISGGYNANLYGYLVLQDANGNTATEVLLNQVGTSVSNPFGSAGSGFDVTLSDSGTANGSIHWATGIPIGTWLPDSAGSLDATFGGLTANGTWTLFLADLTVGGGTSTLASWGLNVTVVPEPGEGLFALGMAALALACRPFVRSKRRKSQETAST